MVQIAFHARTYLEACYLLEVLNISCRMVYLHPVYREIEIRNKESGAVTQCPLSLKVGFYLNTPTFATLKSSLKLSFGFGLLLVCSGTVLQFSINEWPLNVVGIQGALDYMVNWL